MRCRTTTTLGDRLAGRFVVAWLLLIMSGILVVICLFGCATIHPDVVASHAPSWDGSKQNSGLVTDVDSSMVVTPHWRDRYNALAAIYGGNFKPPVTKDEGITPGAPDGNCYANHFARVHFFEMNAWDKSAMHQPAPATLLQKVGL